MDDYDSDEAESGDDAVVSERGVPTIVVHLDAREQFVGLAMSCHRRCGAASPARLITSQPTGLRQLWDLWTRGSSSSATCTCLGLVASSRPDERVYETTLISLRVSDIGGVVPSSVHIGPTTEIGGVLYHRCWCVADPATYRHCGFRAFEKVTKWSPTIMKIACMYRLCITPPEEQQESSSSATTTIRKTNKRNRVTKCLYDEGDLYSLGVANCKWWVYCHLRGTKVLISRITEDSHSAVTLDKHLCFFFFNRTNPDEAVMVEDTESASSFIFSLIDVAQTHSSATARKLSETTWINTGFSMIPKTGLVFHDIHGSQGGAYPRVFLFLIGGFGTKELYAIEECTGNEKLISENVKAVSQLNDAVFCVSLSDRPEYQLWDAYHTKESPLRIVTWDNTTGLWSWDFVIAESGFLFHHKKGESSTVVQVTDSATTTLVLSLKLPPKSTSRVCGFAI